MRIFGALSFVLVFFAATAFGQQSALFLSLGKPLATKKSTATSGSSYLSDEFKKAEVLTNSGKKLPDLPLRYDILNQRVEYSTDNNVYDVTDSVRSFTFDASENHTGKFVKYNSPDGKVSGFLEEIYTGKTNLYKLNTIKKTSEENFYTKQVTQKYTPNNIYFASSGDKFTKIGTSKKDFLNAFKGNQKVKAFLNSTDVDLNSDNSIISLGKLIDQQ
ncbi:hypothetical protein [Mucilaginibacter sp. CSA2-8R]|uniref:hypothetical protein n=1 Tax=Mucilaginibacter sp. CSA2-8R TaxID=3141542 RepID=UPI00315DF90B